MGKKLIYIDVCALCRPFDDQSYMRIKIETEAVNLVTAKIRKNIYELIISPIHLEEIKEIPDEIEKYHLLNFLKKYGVKKKVNLNQIRKRAEELIEQKFGIADAAHVAFAEALEADFISCDDKLLKRCKKFKIKVWCGSPIDFCIKEDLK